MRDAASLLPFVAALLITPPLILIFDAPGSIGGIPITVAYLFGAWALIILTTALLARRLATLDESPPGGDEDARR